MQCDKCKRYVTKLIFDPVPEPYTKLCPECQYELKGNTSSSVYIKTDKQFHPYYDVQLHQHFQTASDKKQWLNNNGYTAIGPACPQSDTPGNFQCTNGQYKEGLKKRRI